MHMQSSGSEVPRLLLVASAGAWLVLDWALRAVFVLFRDWPAGCVGYAM